MKNISLKAEAVKPGNCVTECINLRPVVDADGSAALIPAALPRAIAENAGRPLLEYLCDDGSTALFTASGNRLMIIGGGDTRKATLAATLGGRITCAAAAPRGCVTVMAEGVPPAVARLDQSTGRWRVSKPSRFAEPLVTAETTAVISESPAVTALSQPAYQAAASVTLTAGHRAMLSRAMADAYNRLDARARAAGAWLQPVIARIRYLDSEGHTLHLTSPRLVGLPVTPVAEGELAGDAKSSAVSALTLTARVFRLRLSWPDGAGDMPDSVASIAVEVTPQLHPVDPHGMSECRVSRLTADTMRLQISLPGMRLSESAPEAVARMVPQALCGLDRLSSVTATVRWPAGGVPADTLIGRLRGESAADEVRGITAATCAAKSTAYGLRDAVSAPHSFTARSVAVNGDRVVWTDITALPAEAPSVWSMASSTGQRSDWSGSVQVTFDSTDTDGIPHTSVTTFRHSGPVVNGLSPLIVYPDPRAVSMRVAVGLQAVTLPLTPTPDGRMAYYLSPDLANVKFDTQLTSQIVPAENPRDLRYRGGVVAASADAPAVPLAATVIPGGRVSAAVASVRSRSSWDFGRRHFYLLGSSGIHALAISAAGDSLSAACISPLDASQGACAPTPDGVMAIAAGRLVKISGSAVTMLGTAAGVEAMAFDASRRELWLMHSSRTTEVMTEHGSFTLSLTATAMLGAGGRVYLSCGDGTLRKVDSEPEPAPSQGIKVRWHARTVAAPGRIAAAEHHLAASMANLTLDLRGDGGAGSSQSDRLLSLRVSGRLDSPLRARVVAPPRRNVDVIVNGFLSTDAALRGTNLLLS